MYTKEEVETLEAYPGKTVEELSLELNRSTRSVIAKLAKMGIYKKARLDKTGEEIVSKASLVNVIEDHFGIELPTLVKAGKEDLRKLVEAL